MRTITSAGAKLALVFLLVLAVTGCARPADSAAIRTLVGRFMAIVGSSGGAAAPTDLRQVFTGLDDSATTALTERLALLPRELRYTVRSVRFPPGGGAVVTVALESGPTRGTLRLQARRVDEGWRLDPSFQITQQLGEVRLPQP